MQPGTARWAPLAMIALFVLSAALSMRGNQTPAAIGVDAPATVFSATRAATVLARVLGDEQPHPTGSAANAQVRDRIVAELALIGVQAQIQRRFACGGSTCATVENIVARLPGESADQAVLLAAHYDSVGAGPGASDDGAGVATLIESARALLAGPPLVRDVWLLASDGEELGLIGAEAFVREPEFARIATVINLEARGTRGASLLIETQPGNAQIIAAMRRALPRASGSSLDYEIYRSLPNDTDFSVFRREGREGLNFAWAEGAARYHTPLDNLAHLDRGSLQHHGDNALSMTRELAGRAPGAAAVADGGAAQDAVFFNVFGATFAAWPVALNPFLLALGLVLWLALAVRLVRRGSRPAALASASIAVLALLAVLAGLGWGLYALLQALGAMPAMWTAQGPLLVTAFVALALPAMLLGGYVVQRWRGPPALALATLLPFAIVAAAAVAAMPGASYLGLLPLLAAGLCAHLVPGRAVLRSGLAAVVAAGLWFPYAVDSYAAIGHPGLTATTLLSGVIVLPLLPALLSLRRTAGALALAGLAVAFACAMLALARPAFDGDVPRPANLLYAGDSDSARLYLQPRGTMPVGFMRQAGFADVSRPVTAWLGWGHPGAAGPALSAPTLQVESDSLRDGRRQIAIRVSSTRASSEGGLMVPGDVDVASIRVQGQALAPSRWHAEQTRWRRITIVGLPPEGAVFEFESAPGREIELFGYDRSAGIPAEMAGALRERDAVAMPVHGGDSTVAWQRMAVAEVPQAQK
ncbi:M28 family peptidase [Lysobacter ciconiae]|uniref:M28 family peptidase n=1 Tax=Novilysobacter ciconiae TaxID=2781022 RepID=A0A7S6UEN0_9GAMM|nr:M28 family peptidase [Lysobacter ciconiae]QOW18866.1 M28 family peptidase [Lysobacter ciconiae]